MKVSETKRILNIGGYFCKLAEKSQDVFSIWDMDCTTLLYISPAFKAVWGVSSESITEMNEAWLKGIHPEDRAQYQQQIDLMVSNRHASDSYTYYYRIIQPSGDIRQIHEICFAIHDVDQSFVGFAAISKDITQEKLRLAELEQATRFFHFYAEKVRAVFWARDYSCRHQIYISPGYEKIWERRREDLYANPQSWLDTLIPEDQIKHTIEARFRALHDYGPDIEYEDRYRIYTPSGEIRWIKDRSFPIYDEKNHFIGFAGIAEDISNEVSHQAELQEAKKRAEIANQAKSDFLAMISHELRTPLNAILGMSQILKVKLQSEELREYVDIVNQAGTTLLALVSDVLDFVRLEAGKLTFVNQTFNLKALIIQVINSMEYLAQKKKLKLTTVFRGSELCKVIGDENRVRQVLVNLISNAIKFTEHGSIKVDVRTVKRDNMTVLVTLSVIDSGVGIQSDKIEGIFNQFSQIDSIYNRKQNGIGLGLSITKELVLAMGGDINVKSQYGKGSEFIVHLPFKLTPISESTSHAHSEEGAPHFLMTKKYPIRVLLVEDNLINQKIAVLMLTDFGCQVDVIDNGQSVLDRIDELDQYQLIFMDIGLPDINGFEVVTCLRKVAALQQIPIVAMTAHVLDRDKQCAYSAGMNQVIAKPISYDEISTVLEMVTELLGENSATNNGQ